MKKSNSISSGTNPTGTILAFAGNTIPNGYLLCDGSEISRIIYSNLFAVIGELYGSGDGSTTFNLPDLIGRFLEGGDNTNIGEVKEAGLPNIEGVLTCPNSAATMYGGEWYASAITQTGALTTTSYTNNKAIAESAYTSGQIMNTLSFDASKSNLIYGNSTIVQPLAIICNYVIKY